MLKTKGIVLTTLVSTILILGAFTCSASAAESTPTVWITIHRIQATQSSEYNSHWKYSITVNDQITDSVTQDYICQKTGDDIIVDRDDSFSTGNQNVYITLTVFKNEQGEYEISDVSSLGTTFDCTYNLATDELGGEEITVENNYYKTSGEYDGTLDENDATVWFTISDNYDAPLANAGKDQTVSVRELVNFDASKSTASDGSSITKIEWDFNEDGIIDSNKEKASYRFNENGNYTCKLTVTDSIGAKDEDTCIISVRNKVPNAAFTFSPENPSIQDTINITDNSYDTDGTITSWFWEFGDGTNSTEQNPTHIFNEKAEYKIALSYVKLSPKYQLEQEYTHRALRYLQDFIDTYPSSEYIGAAEKHIETLRNKLGRKLYESGRLYKKMRHWRAAVIYFDEMLANYYDTQWALDAKLDKAYCLIQLRRFDEYQELMAELEQAVELGDHEEALQDLAATYQEELQEIEKEQTEQRKRF